MDGIYHPDMTVKAGRSGYEIRVQDHLDCHWQAWFEGWTVTSLENGETLLANRHVDQPGLHTALNRIRDLNLVLVSVVRIPAGDP